MSLDFRKNVLYLERKIFKNIKGATNGTQES